MELVYERFEEVHFKTVFAAHCIASNTLNTRYARVSLYYLILSQVGFIL